MYARLSEESDGDGGDTGEGATDLDIGRAGSGLGGSGGAVRWEEKVRTGRERLDGKERDVRGTAGSRNGAGSPASDGGGDRGGGGAVKKGGEGHSLRFVVRYPINGTRTSVGGTTT